MKILASTCKKMLIQFLTEIYRSEERLLIFNSVNGGDIYGSGVEEVFVVEVEDLVSGLEGKASVAVGVDGESGVVVVDGESALTGSEVFHAAECQGGGVFRVGGYVVAEYIDRFRYG